MRPFDAAELFFYGTIRALKFLRAGIAFSDYKELVTDVMSDLYHFGVYHQHRIRQDVEQPDELRNTLTAAETLHSFIRGTLYPIRDDLLNEKHIELLGSYLSGFETALKLDLGALPIYVLEGKRGYSARQFVLGRGARQVLSKPNQDLLPSRAKDDIDHAGKCVIHEQYTAAGFHTMRAMESVARRYYKAVTGDEPITAKGEYFTLGVLVDALKGKQEKLTQSGKDVGRLSEDILPILKRIVRTYRNPIMHPEMVLEEDEALDVFDNAKAAIASILRDVKEGGHLPEWNAP
jgi:hypothetical protein